MNNTALDLRGPRPRIRCICPPEVVARTNSRSVGENPALATQRQH